MKKILTILSLIILFGICLVMSVSAASEAVYTLSDTSGSAGDTVRLTLSFTSSKEANSIALAKLNYDTTALTFTGFEDTEAMEDISILPPTFDVGNQAIALALQGTKTSIDPICTLVFKIKDTATPGNYEVSFNTLVTKNGSTPITSSVNKGKIEVKAETYQVSYNANGGTGAPASQIKTHGVNLTLSTTKPTRDGYSFLGWSASPSATSAAYTAGGTYSANADLTLYAVWKQDTSPVLIGDTNGDGILTAIDAVILVRHIANWVGYDSLPYIG